MVADVPILDLAFAVLKQESLTVESQVVDCPTSLIQRRFRLSYLNAVDVITSLEKMGLLERLDDTTVILREHCVREG